MVAYLIKLNPSVGNFADYTVENLAKADSHSCTVRSVAVFSLDSAKVESSLPVATICKDSGVICRTPGKKPENRHIRQPIHFLVSSLGRCRGVAADTSRLRARYCRTVHCLVDDTCGGLRPVAACFRRV